MRKSPKKFAINPNVFLRKFYQKLTNNFDENIYKISLTQQEIFYQKLYTQNIDGKTSYQKLAIWLNLQPSKLIWLQFFPNARDGLSCVRLKISHVVKSSTTKNNTVTNFP